jgi:hypothetical protein
MKPSVGRSAVKRHSLVVPEHPLQRQIADALRLEIAPPGKVSRDGVVWWSVDHASYAGTAPGARVGRGIVAGVPDLFVLFRGIAHMVEIKTPAGELSDPQKPHTPFGVIQLLTTSSSNCCQAQAD